MAFIVSTRPGRFEIRESASTPKGPRSRTLTSFRELDEAVIEKAQKRAAKAIDAADLQQAARKVGAPIAQPPVDRAARELIAQLAKGHTPQPALRHMLLDLLRDGDANGSNGNASSRREAEHAVAEWMAATPTERGKALVDLLLLADALPHSGRQGKPLLFPRLDSSGS